MKRPAPRPHLRFRIRAAFLLALGLAVLFAQTGGQAQATDALPYSTGYLLTGDYVVGSVDITDASALSATATIHIGDTPANTVPPNADILAAFLYWETIAPTWATPPQIADFVKFRGQPIKSVRVKSIGRELTGSTGQCFTAAGPLTMTMFRADVLRLLPPLRDVNGKTTGKLLVNDADLIANNLGLHTVTLPEAGTGNVIPQSAGASLVVVYRDPAQPLRKIVAYDGIYIQPQGETTTQTIRGSYQSDPLNRKAKITHIVGSGANNRTDQLSFNNSVIASDPFPGSSKSSDRSWAAVTIDVSDKMPGTDVNGPYGETVTSKVTHTRSNPYDCLSWTGTWFSTTVKDDEHDGIPDRLEQAAPQCWIPMAWRFPIFMR